MFHYDSYKRIYPLAFTPNVRAKILQFSQSQPNKPVQRQSAPTKAYRQKHPAQTLQKQTSQTKVMQPAVIITKI